MENAALDLGAGVRWMRESLGFDRIVLLGFSGGGSLVSFYQSQAEKPTVRATPAGDPVDFSAGTLSPADAVVLCAAHIGRAGVLSHWIDPSVVDEQDPFAADPDLDLFASDRSLPLDLVWVERYREAQRARVARISAWAREQIALADQHGAPDRTFIVHRTVADPRFMDLTLDPSDRALGSMYGDPRAANLAAGGLARFTTARSWLSTWSIDDTHAHAPRNLATVEAPVLIVSLNADQAAFPSESRAMAAVVPAGGANLVELPGLTHYLVGQEHALDRVVEVIGDWIDHLA